jgi:hypothetical protein
MDIAFHFLALVGALAVLLGIGFAVAGVFSFVDKVDGVARDVRYAHQSIVALQDRNTDLSQRLRALEKGK